MTPKSSETISCSVLNNFYDKYLSILIERQCESMVKNWVGGGRAIPCDTGLHSKFLGSPTSLERHWSVLPSSELSICMACDVSNRKKEGRELTAIEDHMSQQPLFLPYSVLVCFEPCFKIPWLMAPQIHEESSTTECFCIWISGNLMNKCQYVEVGPVLGTEFVKSLYKEISNVGN